MAYLSHKIYSKTFKNKESKKAYLEATKWLAVHVYGKEELSNNIAVQIRKDIKSKTPTFIVTLYLLSDEEQIKDAFCMKCKHLYASFYQIEKMNCIECKVNAYRKHNKAYADGLIGIYEKIFEGIEDEEND